MYRMFRSSYIFALVLTNLAVSSPRISIAAADDQQWGTVRGQVVFDGEKLPKPEKIVAVIGHQDQMHCLSKGDLFKDDWMINKANSGIQGALVWLAPIKKGEKLPIHPKFKKLPSDPLTMDQPCCMFVPHVVIVREGQDLLVKNSSPVAHNVNWQGRFNPGGNVLVPSAGSHTIKGLVVEDFPVGISCNIHPWMKAYAKIINHPYATMTDKDGKFEFRNAPAGEYRLIVWNDIWGPGLKSGTVITIPKNGVLDHGKIGMKLP